MSTPSDSQHRDGRFHARESVTLTVYRGSHDTELSGVHRIVAGVEETVRYTYRLRPGAQAERALMAEWHRCRFLWNEAVHQRRIGNKPNRATVAKMLTAARKTSTWLREGSQNAQACMLETWALANKHSYQVRGRAKPAIKKKHKTLPSLGYNRNGFSIRDGRLRLPKGTMIPVVWSRALPSRAHLGTGLSGLARALVRLVRGAPRGRARPARRGRYRCRLGYHARPPPPPTRGSICPTRATGDGARPSWRGRSGRWPAANAPGGTPHPTGT